MGHNKKVLIMRVFIAVLILIFNLQSLTKADDIRDFEIEGMSIGDSLLDHVNKSELKEFVFPYSKKTFKGVIFHNLSNDYDAIQFSVKANDSNLIIHNISAKIYFENKYNECIDKMLEITEAFESVISDKTKTQSKDNIKRSKESDPSGKSIWSYRAFYFDDGSAAQVFCTDWSNELSKSQNYIDELKAALYSKEFTDFLYSLND
tara:strand:+ start:951 stop:1565 length:615 start_codon:yes stop_codon:yes gene_type:complete